MTWVSITFFVAEQVERINLQCNRLKAHGNISGSEQKHRKQGKTFQYYIRKYESLQKNIVIDDDFFNCSPLPGLKSAFKILPAISSERNRVIFRNFVIFMSERIRLFWHISGKIWFCSAGRGTDEQRQNYSRNQENFCGEGHQECWTFTI